MGQYKKGSVSVRNGVDKVRAVWELNVVTMGSVDSTGISSGATSNTLVDTGIGWTPGEHEGRWVLITGGSALGQARLIVSNTVDTLTVLGNWNTNPTSHAYSIYNAAAAASAWTANETINFQESGISGEFLREHFESLTHFALITGGTEPDAGEWFLGASSGKRGAINVLDPYGTNTPQAWNTEVSIGDIVTIAGLGVFYTVDAITHPWELSLSTNYGYADADEQDYAVTRDFTPSLSIPYPQPGDIEIAAIVREIALAVEGALGAAAAMWASPPSFTGKEFQAARVNSLGTALEWIPPVSRLSDVMLGSLKTSGPYGYEGVIGTATTTSITVSPSPVWQTNEFLSWRMVIKNGSGKGQYRTLTGNTADTINWSNALGVVPSPGDQFRIMSDPNRDREVADEQYVDDAIAALDLTQVDRKGDQMMGPLELIGEYSEVQNASGGSTTTVVRASASWTTNQWQNFDVIVWHGQLLDIQIRQISSNTATVLTVSTAFDVAPASGWWYMIVHNPLEDNEAATKQYVDDAILAAIPANGSWTALTYSGLWADYEATPTTYYPGEFMKDALGFVHLRGTIKRTSTGATPGETIATLPAGNRPTKLLRHELAATTGGGETEITIGSTGVIAWRNGVDTELHLEDIPPFHTS